MTENSAVSRFQNLKKKVGEFRARRERAVGARDQLLAQLKSDYDVDSLEEAEKLLSELVEARDSNQQKFDKALAAFEAKWGEALEEAEKEDIPY